MPPLAQEKIAEEKIVFDALDALGISYRTIRHDPVYTIEDMLRLKLDEAGEIPKNLFLRNASGKQHYVVVLRHEKNVNLKELRRQLGSSALSFASEDRLSRVLGLTRGAVTPFGILNDAQSGVILLLDQDLAGSPSLGFHPNHNTATVFVSCEDMEKVIAGHGNPIARVTL